MQHLSNFLNTAIIRIKNLFARGAMIVILLIASTSGEFQFSKQPVIGLEHGQVNWDGRWIQPFIPVDWINSWLKFSASTPRKARRKLPVRSR